MVLGSLILCAKHVEFFEGERLETLDQTARHFVAALVFREAIVKEAFALLIVSKRSWFSALR